MRQVINKLVLCIDDAPRQDKRVIDIKAGVEYTAVLFMDHLYANYEYHNGLKITEVCNIPIYALAGHGNNAYEVDRFIDVVGEEEPEVKEVEYEPA